MILETRSVPQATPGMLTGAEVQFYKSEGYLIQRGVFEQNEVDALAADVERVCREYRDLMDAHNMRVRFKPHHASNQPVLEVLDPIADLSPVARTMTRDRRMLDRLHDLYGEPAEVLKDKLIYKSAGAEGAALHQDWIAWPGFPESFLTVVVAIDAFKADNGATEVFPRCHRDGYLSAKDGQYHPLELCNLRIEPVPLELDPGDIALFTCFTPHRSAANKSVQPRRGYFISYNACSEGGDQYVQHYREFHTYLRAKAPEDKRPHLFFR